MQQWLITGNYSILQSFGKHLFHFNNNFFRSRKTSITTGIVDRSDSIKQESMDRLSPLTSSVVQFGTQNVELAGDLEQFSADSENDTTTLQPQHNTTNTMHLYPNAANGNVRRHTVGPGDVAHEQALGNTPTIPINFKFVGTGGENIMGPHIPMNLPMLENQPLNTFTIKDQHLLKPPTVMGASMYMIFFNFITLRTKFLQQVRLDVELLMVEQIYTYIIQHPVMGLVK
jgi:serine/threonine-protein kinase SIK3